jgi:hypothetical protein
MGTSEITLFVQKIALICQIDEGLVDRRISMRMKLHRLAHDVGDFVEFIITLSPQRFQDSSLDRLEAINDIRDRPVKDDVRSVLDEVTLHLLFKIIHFHSQGYA